MPFPFPVPPGPIPIDFRGLDIVRGRDVVTFMKGDTQTVTVDAAMLAGGWPGGQGVQYAYSPTDDRVVTYSNGLYGGYLLWGSDESADQYTSMTGQALKYAEAVMVTGRSLISTVSYEKYTYASRIAHALDSTQPLVPIQYNVRDPLYFSLRGLWTNEDEMTLSGAPKAPCFFTGFCAQKPKITNSYMLGIQTCI